MINESKKKREIIEDRGTETKTNEEEGTKQDPRQILILFSYHAAWLLTVLDLMNSNLLRRVLAVTTISGGSTTLGRITASSSGLVRAIRSSAAIRWSLTVLGRRSGGLTVALAVLGSLRRITAVLRLLAVLLLRGVLLLGRILAIAAGSGGS